MKPVVLMGHCATQLWLDPGALSGLLSRAHLEGQVLDAVVWAQPARTYCTKDDLEVVPPFVLEMVPTVETGPCPNSWAELGCCLRIDRPPFVSARMNLYQRNGLSLLEPFRAQSVLVHGLKHDMESDPKV